LDLTGLAKPGKTSGFIGTGTGVAHQGAAGRVFRLVWNPTELFFLFKPGPLAGYLDPLLTQHKPGVLDQAGVCDDGNQWRAGQQLRMANQSDTRPFLMFCAVVYTLFYLDLFIQL